MSRCRSCRADVMWAQTTAGKAMPLDPDPTPLGNVQVQTVRTAERVTTLATVLGPLEVEALDGEARGKLRMPHHATCPDADRWRR